MSYATPTEMLKRYDQRVLADLVTDKGTRPTTPSTIQSTLLSDPNLQAALDDGAGMIDAAVMVAQRYLPSDLLALSGHDQAFLYRLNCNLAYGLLVMRRGYETKEMPQYQESLDCLERLRNGDRVFAVASVEQKGNPTAEFPSQVTYDTVNLMRDTASKYFPVRRQQRVTSG